MAGFQVGPSQRDPKALNPILANLDRAAQGDLSALGPNEHEALKRAGVPVPQPAAPQSPPITNPRPQPPAIAPVPKTAAAGPAEAELARVTAPPPTDPSLVHTKANTGTAGVNQIHNPWARVPLQILSAVGETFAPRLAAALPGTESHHQLLVGNAENAVKQQQTIRKGEEEAQRNAADVGHLGAETANLESQVPLNEARTQTELGKPELNQQAADIRQQQADIQAKKQREDDERLLRTAGYMRDPVTGQPVAIPEEQLSEPERAKIEQIHAITSLRASQQELADANAELSRARASNLPQQMQLAEARIATAQRNSQIAMQRLGLSAQQFEFRSQGTINGVPQAGTMLTDDGRPVGTANAPNVRPTATAHGAAERATTLEDLDTRIRKALQNPEIANRQGPIEGRLSEIKGRYGSLPRELADFQNDLISYGAFQAGLHPVRGIGGLQYFEKVMGGMAQTPEQLLGKLDSNLATAKNVQRVGQPRTVGSNAANPAPSGPPRVQQNSKGEFRYSVDGGKTWQSGKPPQ